MFVCLRSTVLDLVGIAAKNEFEMSWLKAWNRHILRFDTTTTTPPTQTSQPQRNQSLLYGSTQ
jgi:hypothetical protein